VFLKNVKNYLIGSVALAAGALSMFATPQIAVWRREAIFSNSK
jgi:hypothetical protein